ncbi:UDP-N-acetylmuramoyl-L-alanyl-D-glutamate--2,6-diaminopimelate ligase [Piscirickettsia salmonis]|uniref:UDP-N-acetylmuramoyl-L-alanyl-D-glutamate--2, 6-diaminopimelate ligase n=1 Tax=Piscirickettsia salmonis TaxID=1238 RepID=UPI0012B6BF83|nr:UDP-N-acetylmuramoyl-L-alanyl-D-glutamate--2,6-diaminopimelate ligase [Piscirickettsia salmonis]QGP48615.1 UDP-N-acetylmuramoyl-L-alanyl-D-glutamate--2,6-diaminopimelate ligase [Piscirickettsia salmonis]
MDILAIKKAINHLHSHATNNINRIINVDYEKITGITDDSRYVVPGAIFCAYPGENSDGRRYIAQACARGAVLILYEKKAAAVFNIDAKKQRVPAIAVVNLRDYISEFSGFCYSCPSYQLSILGITGTNGKTSVSYLYAQLLSQLDQRVALIGTTGAGIYGCLRASINTTPAAIALQQLLGQFYQQQVTDVAMEVSSHSLVQGRVRAIAMETVIYTNLTQDHLDYHGTMQNYAAAKTRLIYQPGLKNLIINNDDYFCQGLRENAPKHLNIISYGLSQSADVRLIKPLFSKTGLSGELVTPWGQYHLKVPLLGEFNAFNLLAVIAALGVKGISIAKILPLLEHISPPKGRLQTFYYQQALIVVDYAHSPDALEQVLITLKKITTGRLICLFGCGGDRDREKRPLMGKIAEEIADQLILTSDNPRNESPLSIIDEICSGLLLPEQVTIITERKQAIEVAIAALKNGDVLVIAGKGHENYQEVSGQRHYFSDIDLVEDKVRQSDEDITAAGKSD